MRVLCSRMRNPAELRQRTDARHISAALPVACSPVNHLQASSHHIHDAIYGQPSLPI